LSVKLALGADVDADNDSDQAGAEANLRTATLAHRLDGLEGRISQLEARFERLSQAMPAPVAAQPWQATNQQALARPVVPPPVAAPGQWHAGPQPMPAARPPLPASRQPAPPRRPLPDPVALLTKLGPAAVLALVGGGALLLGMAFFLSLAFSRGWIGPEARVALGLLAGFGMLPAGALLFDRERPILGHVVVAVGIGTVELSLFASRLYHLVPAEIALTGALAAALGAGFVAVRWNSQQIAAMALAAVVAAPPVVSAPANLVTVGFLAAVLAGMTYVSVSRAWSWLPWVGFVLAVPQLLKWLEPAPMQAVAARPDGVLVAGVLLLFWALFTIAAVGGALRDAKRPLDSPIALLAGNAAVAVLGAHLAFHGPDEWLRGALLGVLAAIQLALGLGLLRRRGFGDLLGQASVGLGVALYVVAVAAAFDGPAVPIAWTVAMLGLAWVWARLHNRWAGVAAMVVGGIVAGHLMLFEYPILTSLFGSAPRAQQVVPYLDGEGMALGLFLLALAVVALLARRDRITQLLAAAAIALVAYTVPAEARDLAPAVQSAGTLAGWVLLALGALAADGRWHARWRLDRPKLQPLPVVGSVIGLFAVRVLGVEYGLGNITAPTLPPVPFVDERTLAAGAVIVAVWILAALRRHPVERTLTLAASVVVAAALLRQELPLEWAVVGWSGLAVAAAVAGRARGRPALIADAVVAGLLAVSAIAILGSVAPISRLAVDFAGRHGAGPPNAATIATLGLVAGLIAASWRRRLRVPRDWLAGAAFAVAVYGLSVALVDSFAVRVTTAASVAEIGTQAQVGLTILWAIIGLASLGLGLARDHVAIRAAGLALLALATAKAFVYDLSSLDVAYRVLSFIGLGLLLLAGAFAYQRLRRRAASGDGAATADIVPVDAVRS
jgi:uncharacterized membrane protein